MCNKFVLFDVREGRVSTQDASLYAAANDPTDFARCLISLLDDAALRADMGASGYKRVFRGLSWETQIPSVISAYTQALK